MDFLDLDIFTLRIPFSKKKNHGDIVCFFGWNVYIHASI